MLAQQPVKKHSELTGALLQLFEAGRRASLSDATPPVGTMIRLLLLPYVDRVKAGVTKKLVVSHNSTMYSVSLAPTQA